MTIFIFINHYYFIYQLKLQNLPNKHIILLLIIAIIILTIHLSHLLIENAN